MKDRAKGRGREKHNGDQWMTWNNISYFCFELTDIDRIDTGIGNRVFIQYESEQEMDKFE